MDAEEIPASAISKLKIRIWTGLEGVSFSLRHSLEPPSAISVVVWHDNHNCSWWFCYYSVVCLSCCCFCSLCQIFDTVFVLSRGSSRAIYINDWVKWAQASLNELGHGWVVRWKVRLGFYFCCTIQHHFQSRDPAVTWLNKNDPILMQNPTSLSVSVTMVTFLMNIVQNGPCLYCLVSSADDFEPVLDIPTPDYDPDTPEARRSSYVFVEKFRHVISNINCIGSDWKCL